MTTPDKQSRNYIKKGGVSTRDAIIDKAREIINNGGVIDFRIETLAMSLGLSPGNITYHFPRKEDIINAIWEQLKQQNDILLDMMITPLLDIKQLFLVHRSAALKSLEFLGVKSYYNGDVGNLIREAESNRKYVEIVRNLFFQSYVILHKNGYIEKITDPTIMELLFQEQFIILRWWFNKSMLSGNIDKVKEDVDQYVINAIYPLSPYFTESGQNQFNNIKQMINKF